MTIFITYTQFCADRGCHIEQHTMIQRTKKPTIRGAQRIIRKLGMVGAIVISVDSLVNCY